MAQKQYIKYLWEKEDKSLREISRICDLNFRTVEKYAKQEEWTEKSAMATAPRYPVLGDYLHLIDEWLKNDGKEPRKQRRDFCH